MPYPEHFAATKEAVSTFNADAGIEFEDPPQRTEDTRFIDFTPALRAELLNRENWDRLLELFARTANLAVALIGGDGALIGECHNPNPIWVMARAAKPVLRSSCPFCLETQPLCRAAADAVRTGSVVLVRDRGGFAHAAVPLLLGEHYLGTLLAGQILDSYPEVLPLERVARDFSISPQRVWNLARQQAPMSHARLKVFAELLQVLGQTFLQDHYGSFLERTWTSKAIVLNRELATLNTTLARKIVELDQLIVEKEILLKEVHHRVKNNLQVVSGLLSLQMEEENPAVSARLRDAYDRIHSMSLVHEHIYRSTSLADLDLGEYVENLALHLYQSYCQDRQRIGLEVAAESMRLAIDQAIPCGLILNELISNALKHAFSDGRDGLLQIIFRTMADNQAVLIVADNGKGMPAGFAGAFAKSMGMQVVRMLTRQMEGTLEMTQDCGTRFVLSWQVTDRLPALKMTAHS